MRALEEFYRVPFRQLGCRRAYGGRDARATQYQSVDKSVEWSRNRGAPARAQGRRPL